MSTTPSQIMETVAATEEVLDIASIKDAMDAFDPAALLPNLSEIFGSLATVCRWAVMIGPLVLLVLGLAYLLLSPKEANYYFGYRCYYGMGSVQAWRFTQRVSGIIMTVTGLILTIIAYSAVKKFADMDLMEMGKKAFSLIKGQVICAFVIYVFMFLLTAVLFDRKGYPRFGSQSRKALSQQSVPVKEEPAPEVPQEEEEPVLEYEKQGEQVITAEDIVIEGLE